MKTLLVAVALFTTFGFHEKTATIKVSGKCEMCKSAIEKSLNVAGVSKASWDVKDKLLTVTYDTHVISLDQIQQKVADAGYDTEKFKATAKSFDLLPGCCKYDRAKESASN